ncbi:MAG TPA: 4-hydroxy-3-methylbut-2-enyl diphosphate reductase [Bacteroidales bacterium]|nr:4-hydroxy-3-methylbut-2-enyl diphosphate reductase [Bacteroidales bacterium]
MLVETDSHSGFCFGVRNAVAIAEKSLLNGERVFSLGPIVHNDREVERLSSLGLISIDHNRFRELRNCKVLIRAHGEPPETYVIAENNNIEIIEATCPIVRRLQSRIRQTWHKVLENNGSIVIFGKKGHAEVVGLMGQINNEGILVSGNEDIDNLDVTKPIYLFAQTTMSVTDYSNIAEAIRNKMRDKNIDPSVNLVVHSTTCGQVSNREPQLREFAEKHDVVVFVSGKESSNGRMLYSVCKNVNPDTYFISSPEEIDASWFIDKKSAGICGATSTPKWLIEKTASVIRNLKSDKP